MGRVSSRDRIRQTEAEGGRGKAGKGRWKELEAERNKESETGRARRGGSREVTSDPCVPNRTG